jgi:iron complex transport system substrate-binding protein
VSLHDVTTEAIVALGARGRLAAVARPVQLPADVTAAIADLPRVEGPESILAARPTLVVGLRSAAERSPELVATLRARGIASWFGAPATLDESFALVEALGAQVGAAERGRDLAAHLRARAAALPPLSTRARRVFIYDCCDPAFTAGGRAVLSDLVRRAGGRNVFEDLEEAWTKVSWEEVVARRPELVVVHAYEYDGQGDVEDKRRRLRAIRALADLPVTVLPLGLSLGGIRSVDALERLRHAIGEPG